jgi:hypothetical protein
MRQILFNIETKSLLNFLIFIYILKQDFSLIRCTFKTQLLTTFVELFSIFFLILLNDFYKNYFIRLYCLMNIHFPILNKPMLLFNYIWLNIYKFTFNFVKYLCFIMHSGQSNSYKFLACSNLRIMNSHYKLFATLILINWTILNCIILASYTL